MDALLARITIIKALVARGPLTSRKLADNVFDQLNEVIQTFRKGEWTNSEYTKFMNRCTEFLFTFDHASIVHFRVLMALDYSHRRFINAVLLYPRYLDFLSEALKKVGIPTFIWRMRDDVITDRANGDFDSENVVRWDKFLHKIVSPAFKAVLTQEGKITRVATIAAWRNLELPARERFVKDFKMIEVTP